MAQQHIFIEKNVILLKIDESDLSSFVIDFDINDIGEQEYMIDLVTSSITNALPEYVYAHFEPSPTAANSVKYVSKAAKSMFKVERMFPNGKKINYYDLLYRALVQNDDEAIKQLKELKHSKTVDGDFGELILHILLRDFKNTVPLISKVYLKDSNNVPAHGFDAVHITEIDEKTRYLWLGESKFYKDPKVGIDALVNDLSAHFNKDFLEQQISVIKKNVEAQQNIESSQRDKWICKLNACQKLKDIVSVVNVPLLCTYECETYANHTGNWSDKDMEERHFTSIRNLKKYFDEKTITLLVNN